MDDKLNEKTESVIDNLLTIAGAACLIYPLIKQATKSLTPEIERLMSEETLNKIPSLETSQDKQDISKTNNNSKHESEHKSYQDEIAELKQKLSKYEEKSEEHKEQPTQQERYDRTEHEKHEC